MTKLNLLKRQIQLYSKNSDLPVENKKDILETLDEVVSELKKKVQGKSTSIDTDNSMNDITMLQLTGIITESELKIYAEKYKEYPMILNFLKQIGLQNGYCLSFKSMYDANKIIENVEFETRDFLENYNPLDISSNHRSMLLDEDNYYDKVEQQLNSFIEENLVSVTKI